MRLTISDDSRRNGLLRHTTYSVNLKYYESSGIKVFETIKGSSRIIKGVLTEQDILSAPPSAPSAELERMVGDGRRGPMPMPRPMGSPMGGRKSAAHSMGAYM